MDSTQSAVYSLVQRFVQRQQIVFDVMKEFRPYFVGIAQPRPSKEYFSATSKGYWGKDKEWQYFMHGIGCRLIHTSTQEIIEWDGANLLRFDRHWFVDWVRWLLRYNPQDDAVVMISSQVEDHSDSLRIFIFNSLEQLQQLGILRVYPHQTQKYELIPADGNRNID